jgi:hypothetical protein
MKINARENRVLVILSGSLLFWPFPERLDLHTLLFWPFLERLNLLAHSFYSLTRSGSLQCESTCSKSEERHAALCDSGTQVCEIVSRDCLSLPGRDVGCFWCIEISPHVHDSVKLHYFFSDRLYYNCKRKVVNLKQAIIIFLRTMRSAWQHLTWNYQPTKAGTRNINHVKHWIFWPEIPS